MTKNSRQITYGDAFLQGLKPDPLMTVSAWADQHRMLTSVASGEPGPWRTSRTPYLKEIMDCLSPSSPVERVVFMKGAQLGGTEAGLCWVGYVIHQAPGPMLLVQPTVETAKRHSKQRIDPLIEASGVLNDLVKDPRSRDSGNTVLGKKFPGGVLIMTGANSAVGLRSMPVRFLFLDEIDGYPGDGDPVALAVQRTVTTGVDVQDDRLEVEVVGWGRDEESWSVDYRILWGDPSGPTVWQDLDNLLRRPFPHARQMSDLHIRAAAVDSVSQTRQPAPRLS